MKSNIIFKTGFNNWKNLKRQLKECKRSKEHVLFSVNIEEKMIDNWMR